MHLARLQVCTTGFIDHRTIIVASHNTNYIQSVKCAVYLTAYVDLFILFLFNLTIDFLQLRPVQLVVGNLREKIPDHSQNCPIGGQDGQVPRALKLERCHLIWFYVKKAKTNKQLVIGLIPLIIIFNLSEILPCTLNLKWQTGIMELNFLSVSQESVGTLFCRLSCGACVSYLVTKLRCMQPPATTLSFRLFSPLGRVESGPLYTVFGDYSLAVIEFSNSNCCVIIRESDYVTSPDKEHSDRDNMTTD